MSIPKLLTYKVRDGEETEAKMTPHVFGGVRINQRVLQDEDDYPRAPYEKVVPPRGEGGEVH
jgi:hypothetical protein